MGQNTRQFCAPIVFRDACKFVFFILQILFFVTTVFSDNSDNNEEIQRSLNDIFPDLSETIISETYSSKGYSSYMNMRRTEVPNLTLNTNYSSIVTLAQSVIDEKPLYIIESLFLLEGSNVSIVDVYNALGKVRLLQGRVYNSASRGGKMTALFEEASRIESEKKFVRIEDPPPEFTAPESDQMYMLLKATHFGNCYFKANIVTGNNYLFYSINNFKSVNFIFPIIKPNRFIVRLYIEPVTEGVLIYGITGVDVPDFIASMVNIPSLIQKRLDVIYSWLIDGISR